MNTASEPLSRQLAREAGRQLNRGSEIGLYLGVTLQLLAIEVNSVEHEGDPPISLDAALDRLGLRMGRWPVGLHPVVDGFRYRIAE